MDNCSSNSNTSSCKENARLWSDLGSLILGRFSLLEIGKNKNKNKTSPQNATGHMNKCHLAGTPIQW